MAALTDQKVISVYMDDIQYLVMCASLIFA